MSEQFEARLTPEGEDYLNGTLGEFRHQVLRAASGYALGREIGARDIADATRTVLSTQISSSARDRAPNDSQRFQLLLFAYSVIGSVAGAVALVIAINGVDVGASPALIATTVGFSTAVVALLATTLKHPASKTPSKSALALSPEFEDTYLRQWQQIEDALRTLAEAELKVNTREAPFGAVINALRRSGRLSPDAVEAVLKALEIRNSIVHGRRFSSSAARSASDAVGRLSAEVL